MERLVEFGGNHPGLFLALAAIVLALAWTTFRGRMLGFRSVEPIEAIQLINHEDAVVLDIREEHELKDGKILNAVHIPLGRLKDSLDKLDKYKDRPIIASCRSGSRSHAACATLGKSGFTRVYNLKGGILAWQNASLPLVKK